MKIDLSKLTSLLARFKYGKRLYPQRDWLVLLGISLVALLGIALIHTASYFFGTDIAATLETVPDAEGPSPELFKEVDSLLNERAQEEAKYRSGHVFVDPSL